MTNPTRVAGGLQLRFWRAEDRMLAARVPDADIVDRAYSEPVTVSGYYPRETVSGRPAWARYTWRDGRCDLDHVTYDPETDRACTDLIVAGADPLWRNEAE